MERLIAVVLLKTLPAALVVVWAVQFYTNF